MAIQGHCLPICFRDETQHPDASGAAAGMGVGGAFVFMGKIPTESGRENPGGKSFFAVG